MCASPSLGWVWEGLSPPKKIFQICMGNCRGYSKDFFQLHKFHVRCKFEGGGVVGVISQADFQEGVVVTFGEFEGGG